MKGRVLAGGGVLHFVQFGLDRDIPTWVEPRWSMPVLDLGPGTKFIPNTVRMDYPEFNFDGEDGAREALAKYADNSVGGVYAVHVMEHLADPRPLIREVSRVLAPGCPFSIFVPHGQALVFLQDLDHKTPFVLDTWRCHLDNPYYSKGREGLHLRVGANFTFAVKEQNTMLVTQLIKMREGEEL
jgi:SAM-dependent methyltransferase